MAVGLVDGGPLAGLNKPRGRLAINWSHPLTHMMASCIIPTEPTAGFLPDLASGWIATSGIVAQILTKYGWAAQDHRWADAASRRMASAGVTTQPFTVAIFAYFKTFPTTGQHVIGRKEAWTTSTNNQGWSIACDSTPAIWFGVRNNNDFSVWTNTPGINSGDFVFLVARFKGTGTNEAQLWKNAALLVQGSATAGWLDTANTYRIGTLGGGGDIYTLYQYFWRRTITDQEITQLTRSPYEFLYPIQLRVFLSGLLETPVSHDDVVPWGALGTLAPDRMIPFESLSPAIADRILPWESLGAVRRDGIIPWESLASALQDATIPFEALSAAIGDRVIPWEALGMFVRDGVVPFESVSLALLARLISWEALSEQLGEHIVPWDATSPAVFEDAIVPWDTVSSTLGDQRVLWEVLGLGMADHVEPWESLGIGFADHVVPCEVLGVAAIDRLVLWELLGAAAADQLILFEVLSLGTVDRVVLWESLGAGVSDRVMLWETLGVLGRDRVVPWDALGTTAADRSIPFEALEALARDAQLPWEALAVVLGDRILLVEALAVMVGNNIIPLSADGSVLGDREIPWEARGVSILIRLSDVAMAGGALASEAMSGPMLTNEGLA